MALDLLEGLEGRPLPTKEERREGNRVFVGVVVAGAAFVTTVGSFLN